MPLKSSPLRTSFEGGRWSRKLLGRYDLEGHRTAVERIENMFVQAQGGVTRRPGTHFVREAQFQEGPQTRLVPFLFGESYVLEFGPEKVRFHSDGGLVLSPKVETAIVNGDFSNGLVGWTNVSSGGGTADVVDLIELIPDSEGTAVGNMTALGGLAAAFSGADRKEWADGAVAGTLPAYVGKAYTTARRLVRVDIFGSFDRPFKYRGSEQLTFVVEGSNDGFVAQADELGRLSVPDRQPYGKVTFDDSRIDDAEYKAFRIKIVGGDHKLGVSISRIKFWKAGPAVRRARLTPNNGVGALRQLITVGASYRGVPHTLRWRVVAKRGASVAVRIGRTAGGQEYLTERTYANGVHQVTFTPVASSLYVEFRTSATGDTVFFDDVSFSAIDDPNDVPYTLRSPYSRYELHRLQWVQSGDVMRFVSGTRAPMALIRRADNDWSFQQINFIDGPYLDENTNSRFTITASATSGTDITLTCSNPLWNPKHVGALWQLKPSGGSPGWKKWAAGESLAAGTHYRQFDGRVYRAVLSTTKTTGNLAPVHGSGTVSDGEVDWTFRNRKGIGYVEITKYVSPTEVRARVLRVLDDTLLTGSWSWREGAFSNFRGWPTAIAIHAGRLVLAKTPYVYMSRPGALTDFQAYGDDDDALTVLLTGALGSDILWVSGSNRLLVGTSDKVILIRSSSEDGDALTPKNVQAKEVSAIGSAPVPPVWVGDTLLYLSASGRRLYELSPDISKLDRVFSSAELTLLCDDALHPYATRLAFAPEPFPLVFALRQDGTFSGLTYQRSENVVAWHGPHRLGGRSARVLDMTVVPGSRDLKRRDELWLLVSRVVDGQIVYHVEYMELDVEAEDDPREAWHLDAALGRDGAVYDNELTVPETANMPERVADFVTSKNIFTASDVGRQLRETNRPGIAEIVRYLDPRKVRCRILTPWTSAGAVRKSFQWAMSTRQIGGLQHLAGEQVRLLVDGWDGGKIVVPSNGTITLAKQAFTVTVGFNVPFRVVSLPLLGYVPGYPRGGIWTATSFKVGVLNSMQLKVHLIDEPGEPGGVGNMLDFDQSPLQPPELKTGEREVVLPAVSTEDPRIVIYGDGPLPLTVTHVVIWDASMEVTR